MNTTTQSVAVPGVDAFDVRLPSGQTILAEGHSGDGQMPSGVWLHLRVSHPVHGYVRLATATVRVQAETVVEVHGALGESSAAALAAGLPTLIRAAKETRRRLVAVSRG